MSRRSRKTFTLAAGLIGVLGLSSLVFGHGVWDHSSGWSESDLPQEYRLTQDQAQELGKLRARYGKKLLALQQKAVSKSLELDAFLSGTDGDAARITELRRQIRDLEYRMEDLWLEANAAATRRLTRDQRAYFGDSFDLLDSTDSLCSWDRVLSRGVAMMDWSRWGRSRSSHQHSPNCRSCW